MKLKTALLLVDHGSKKTSANDLLHEVGQMLQKMNPNVTIKIAHMELAEPTIAQGFQACADAGAEEIIVHPYMLSPGRHSTVDIPRMVEECGIHFPNVRYRVTDPLGLHEKICEVVLERSGLT